MTEITADRITLRYLNMLLRRSREKRVTDPTEYDRLVGEILQAAQPDPANQAVDHIYGVWIISCHCAWEEFYPFVEDLRFWAIHPQSDHINYAAFVRKNEVLLMRRQAGMWQLIAVVRPRQLKTKPFGSR